MFRVTVFGVKDSGYRGKGQGVRVWGSRFRVQGIGIKMCIVRSRGLDLRDWITFWG